MSDVRQQVAEQLAVVQEQVRGLLEQHDALVHASQASNADDEHDPEGSTIAFERQMLGTLIATAEQAEEELRTALERIDSGDYGTCERCGRRIAAERLEARPQARTCIDCARAR